MRPALKRSTPRWLALCALVLGIHLILLLAGSFARSYDAWTHLFLASHWQQSWWWDAEPRWYGGFSVFTYPPLAHQSLALPGLALGPELAYILMQTLVLAALGLGIWRYTRIWFDARAAWLATLLGLSLPSLAMTVHLFGQYPNTVSLALVLNLLPWVDRWFRQGDLKDFARAELLLIPAALTSLFTNFLGLALFALPVLIHSWREAAPSSGRKALRLAGLLGLGGATLALCLWPVFAYLQRSPLVQATIPHASRGKVLLDAQSYFTFYGLYGPTLLLLPALLLWLLRRRRFGFALPALFLLLLSTGGTWGLNQRLLGSFFEILTFDRFAFWNTLLLLPPTAAMAIELWDQGERRLARPQLLALAGIFWALWLTGFGANALSPFWKPIAPLLATDSLARRLDQPDLRHYRFLSLGLGGNNLAALTSRTAVPSIDGNYNFARRLRALNQAPIALLDEAKYYGDASVDALAKFLADPAPYHLRWVLLRDRYYTPLLQATGWILKESLGQDVQLWETRTPITPLPPQPPPPGRPTPAHLFWGIAPLLPLGLLALWLAIDKARQISVSTHSSSSSSSTYSSSTFSSPTVSSSTFSSSPLSSSPVSSLPGPGLPPLPASETEPESELGSEPGSGSGSVYGSESDPEESSGLMADADQGHRPHDRSSDGKDLNDAKDANDVNDANDETSSGTRRDV